MKISELVTSAQQFSPVPADVVAEFAHKRETIVALINQRMLNRADIDALVGPDNLQMMKDNHANHALFMESLLQNYNARVLVDTVLWVFRAYRSRNFHTNYWAAQLNAWVEVLRQELSSDSFAAVFPLYRWMIVHIPQFTQLSDTTGDNTKA